jgi:hypothetical protein
MSPGRSITLSVYDFNMTTASGTPGRFRGKPRNSFIPASQEEPK